MTATSIHALEMSPPTFRYAIIRSSDTGNGAWDRPTKQRTLLYGLPLNRVAQRYWTGFRVGEEKGHESGIRGQGLEDDNGLTFSQPRRPQVSLRLTNKDDKASRLTDSP